MENIIIIGAGAAGLAAARRLQEAGAQPLVLEARERIGGRIWTDYTHGPVELGAEFIHGDQAATWAYVRAAGLHTVPWGSNRRFARGGVMLDADDPCVAEVYDLYEAVANYDGPEISAATLLGQLAGPSSPAALIALRWLANLEGADPELLSASAFAHERTLCTNGIGNFHLLDGYERLVASMADGLTIKTDCAVEQIRWRRGSAVLDLAHGEQLEAHRLIITVPLGLLKAGRPCFAPALPDNKRAAIGSIAMGHVTKLVLWFDRQLWPEFAALSTDGRLATWWPVASATTPTLMAYQGGDTALRVAALGEDQAIDVALTELTALFGREVRQSCLGGRLADWASDPWSLGAYSYSSMGIGESRAILAAPVDDVLYFAGEACVVNGHLATVHGAIESGQRAAQEVLRV